MDDFEKELKIGFLTEAEQSLADVEQCFLELESNGGDPENLNKIFRLAHNLKGSSKAVGFDEMGALTHEFETFILKIKNDEMSCSAEVVSFLLRCNDFLRGMVAGLQSDLAASFDIAPLIQEMHSLNGAPAADADPVLEPNLELLAELGALPAAAEEKPAPPAPVAAAPAAAAPAAHAPPKPAGEKTDDSLRVALSKVEGLLNAVGEMVVLQSVLCEQADASNDENLRKTVAHLSKVGKEIQDLSMSLRMVAIKPTFQKMQRIVRDTSNALGKDVAIQLGGEETEIDKTVLERVNDPLVHLVRNSVDHGIEAADVRLARGKPAKGAVRLSAFHEGGRFVIEVADDGGGLDPDKLIRKAIEKKLIPPNAKLGTAEAYNLIFAPGFSTKEQVTDVSGRGVGMDVVKTNITALGGEIEIRSELGKGSTFRILLPLTLAIIEGMIVRASGHRFVVPMGHIHETLQPEEKQVQQTQVGEIMMLRGENVPLHRLTDFFGIPSEKPAHELTAFVIRSGGRTFGLLVDDVVAQSQFVVKRLGGEFKDYRGVGGSTILGDGKPVFILEPPDLFRRAHKPSYKPKAAPAPLKGVAA